MTQAVVAKRGRRARSQPQGARNHAVADVVCRP